VSDDISIPSPTYRVPRHSRGMDPGTRKLALIAAGIGGFLIAVGGGWHMMSHHHGGVPVVQADPGPMRVKPVNPGGMQVAGANNDIFSGGSDTADAKLAPPPQTPDPQALQAMEAPPKPIAPPPAEPQSAVAQAASQAAAPAAALPPPAPVQAAREAPAAPVQQAPVAQTAAPALPAHAADKLAATAASRPAAGGKDVQVQLAALSSEEAARQEWDRLMRRWPDLLRGHRPSFSQIDRDGHVFWRVRASGFDGPSDAAVFCQQVRAKGGGCSVADF
jgi:hypothetical protein